METPLNLDVTKNVMFRNAEFCVRICKLEERYGQRGGFEMYNAANSNAYHVEGGLWFEDDGKTLCDYDGVFALPKPVIDLLRECGLDPSYAE